MNKMPPKCPYCNEELDYEEQIDLVNEGDYCYDTWRGFCPKCNHTFVWDEIYNFSRCDNLEEQDEKWLGST